MRQVTQCYLLGCDPAAAVSERFMQLVTQCYLLERREP
jgi:hypothetical protein